MKNSPLLEHVLLLADSLRKEDGKKYMSADYFIISLFTIIANDESSNAEGFSGIIGTEEEKSELAQAEELTSKYKLNYMETAQKIRSVIQAESHDSFMNETIFGKFKFTAEMKSEKSGEKLIRALSIAELILLEPSDSILKYVINNGVQSESENDKEQAESLDLAKMISDIISEDEHPAEDITGTNELPISSREQFFNTVDSSKNIQSFLLNEIFGQDQAVNAFVSGYFQSQIVAQIQMDNKKPQATFLFAGPPGVGKTFLAEKVAEALELPYRRFDMSEYSDKEANIEFCGSDRVYKNAKAGNVTSFVDDNPKCVLLFDEIEKAHINVIYLFLQILDAGRIRDNYTDEEVSFTDAILIFTTNVGKNLYDDPSIANLSSVPRKTILKALASDINPITNAPMFPAAICSRFASGNVIMFNRLNADNLLTIASKTLKSNIDGFEEKSEIKVTADSRISTAILLAEGGKADARTVKGRATAFFHEELFELMRLITADNKKANKKLKELEIKLSLDGCDSGIINLFKTEQKPKVLVFAEPDVADKCKSLVPSATIYTADDIETAQDILFNHDITIILCDVNCKASVEDSNLLNAEDMNSVGISFLNLAVEKYCVPVFLLQNTEKDMTPAEYLSFAKIGIQGIVYIQTKGKQTLDKQVMDKCDIACQQNSLLELAKMNKVLTYKTSQTINAKGTKATINLFGFKLSLATDTDDSKSILGDVSKPNVCFNDVIGAEDAKEELKYFAEFLKNPKAFVRKGLKAPKGILLYGPPGTGKTLLAKALAGESGITFLAAEGNQFLKKYVGEGSESVHALFASARKYAPAILFVDEIDAIGKERSANALNDTSGDVLTAFLTEMDGFNTDNSKPIFVLAATNFDVESGSERSLDSALLRRFDRRIFVDLPGKEDRKKFILMRMSKTPSVVLSDEQIDNLATRSTGMSLAQLDSVFELALRNAVRAENISVDDAAFEEAFETFTSGVAKKWSEDSLLRTARHEAGHALMCWLSGEKPSYLTIVARGNHGGYMQHGDTENKETFTKRELIERIKVALGGRASEIVYYGKEDGVSTGASGDLKTATQIAEQMICNYGMDDTCGMAFMLRDDLRQADDIRMIVNAILKEALAEAINSIQSNKAAIDALVYELMSRNHLKENEIDEIIRQSIITMDK